MDAIVKVAVNRPAASARAWGIPVVLPSHASWIFIRLGNVVPATFTVAPGTGCDATASWAPAARLVAFGTMRAGTSRRIGIVASQSRSRDRFRVRELDTDRFANARAAGLDSTNGDWVL